VVEAFGARKCPKLIEQLQAGPVHVKINALRAIGDVLKNPYDIVACIRAGLIGYAARLLCSTESFGVLQ
jgi:hypothetical protein